jgi:hypothetical protein
LNKAKLRHIPRTTKVSESKSYNLFSQKDDSSGRLNSPTHSIGKSEYREFFSENKHIVPIRKWKENEMVPRQKIKKSPAIVDYLLEKRIKNDELSNFGDYNQPQKNRKSLDWKTLVKDMNQKEKLEFLIEKAKAIEQKVEMKNKLNSVEFDPKINEECDDMLIDALKAKIAALDDE